MSHEPPSRHEGYAHATSAHLPVAQPATGETGAAATPAPGTPATRAELIARLTAAREKSRNDHMIVRTEALRMRTNLGLCSSGVASFFERLGIPADGSSTGYDGKLTGTWASRTELGGIEPQMLSDAGLEAAFQAETATHEAWLAEVRKRVLEHVNGMSISAREVEHPFVALGLPPLQHVSKYDITLTVECHEPADSEHEAGDYQEYAAGMLAAAYEYASTHIPGSVMRPESDRIKPGVYGRESFV